MYELTCWNGQEQKILIEKVLLDDSILNAFNDEINDDVIDIEYAKNIKKADRLDYSFATFSGVFSFLVDRVIRTSNHEIKADDLNLFISLAFKMNDKSDEQEIDDYLSKVDLKAKNVNDYVEFAKDLKNEFNYRGLLLSILSYVFQIEVGKDEKDQIVINKIEDKYPNTNRIKKVGIAIVAWLLEQAESYKENNGKFKQECNETIKYVKMLKEFEPNIKELAHVLKNFDKEELRNWFVEQITKDKEFETLDAFTVQNIAVNLNIILVHTYAHIKNFIQQVKEHNVQSLEGLKIIDFNRFDNKALIKRLDLVSTAVFAALDFTYAGIKAAKEEDKIKVFAANINIVNALRLVVVLKDDGKQIIEDFHDYVHAAKIEEVHQYKEISDIELEQCIGLNAVETRILYSLELDMINEDIQATKENTDQLLKEDWKQKWMEISREANPEMNKLFEMDREKVYKALITNAVNKPDQIWLYNIVSEMRLFQPYIPIFNDKKKDKKITKLKLEHKTYFRDIFCKKQNCIEKNEIDDFFKCYKQQYNYLDNKTLKYGATAVGVLAITGLTGGLAYAFAPEIAVAIFGGAFPTLHGAALTSASLAAAGGGALAAGGLGMSGGALIITGGGALLGLGTTGAASGLFLAPKFVQNDNAKLLAKCEYVLLGKMDRIDEVVSFQKKTAQSLDQQQIRLDVLQNIINPSDDTKKKIKVLKKSLEYTDRTNKAFLKMIDYYEKHQK